MRHTRTAPFHPQSNGKLEHSHKSLKVGCIRPKTPLSVAHARKIVSHYVSYYCTERPHSTIGYIAPKDKLEGRAEAIFAGRHRKLDWARERRKLKHQEARRKGAMPFPFTLTEAARTGTLRMTGETEAGSAGLRRAPSSRTQPTRDNRSGQRCEVDKGMDSTTRPLPPNPITSSPLMAQRTQLPMTGEHP
jgi:hypothetical protein